MSSRLEFPRKVQRLCEEQRERQDTKISSDNPVRIISRWLTSPLSNTIAFFGSALNLNVHFHMLLLDGVYDVREENNLRLHRTRAPASAQLMRLAATIARRVCREDGLDAVRMHAITYRIAIGPHAGRKVTTVQTLPGDDEPPDGEAAGPGVLRHQARLRHRYRDVPALRWRDFAKNQSQTGCERRFAGPGLAGWR